MSAIRSRNQLLQVYGVTAKTVSKTFCPQPAANWEMCLQVINFTFRLCLIADGPSAILFNWSNASDTRLGDYILVVVGHHCRQRH